MPATKQLAAHLAVRQLDELRKHLVLSYQPAVDACIAEARERHTCKLAGERLVGKMNRVRSIVLKLDDAIVDLRHECGTDRAELPPTDDEVDAEADRIHEKHRSYRRRAK